MLGGFTYGGRVVLIPCDATFMYLLGPRMTARVAGVRVVTEAVELKNFDKFLLSYTSS